MVGAEPTLADWLALSRPHLSKELVDDEAFGQLLQMARHLPGDVMAALELRLGAEKAPVDLSVRLLDPVQGLFITPHLPPDCQLLDQFLNDWAEDMPSTRCIHSLWFEFDTVRLDGTDLPTPVVCARLRSDAEAEVVIADLLPRLHGSPLAALQQELLYRTWEECSDCVTPLYIFSLRARQTSTIRIEVYSESMEQLQAWWARMEHPTEFDPTSWRISILKNVDRIHLSCEIDCDGWSRRVGLEGSFRRWPHREEGWHNFIDLLTIEGLCTPKKAASIWNWPGYKLESRDFMVRALSHIKLDLQPDQAKLYLLLHMLKTTETPFSRVSS